MAHRGGKQAGEAGSVAAWDSRTARAINGLRVLAADMVQQVQTLTFSTRNTTSFLFFCLFFLKNFTFFSL